MPDPYRQLQLRRGVKADLPDLAEGEPGFCEDTKELFVGTSTGNKKVNRDFTASISGNWVGTPPATLEDAINRIANALVAYIGGPIP